MTDFPKRTIKDIPLTGMPILLRADYNVPVAANGQVHDSYRITQSIPTIKALLALKTKIVICSHLGRPEGKTVPSMSLAPVAVELTKLLGQEVKFVPECVGDQVVSAVAKMNPGDVILLENLRFHEGEEKNDLAFATRLAHDSGARYFVQDGFGVVHRTNASTVAITHRLPSVAGPLVEKEYVSIRSALDQPKRPLTVIMGGAKVADKIDLIGNMIDVADIMVIGGAIANTFLKFYNGNEIGTSFYDEDGGDAVATLMHKLCKKWCRQNNACQCESCPDCSTHLILPRDVAVAPEIEPHAVRKEVSLDNVTPNDKILDVGEHTARQIVAAIESSRAVIWNGTLGYAELPQFADSSNAVAATLASRRQQVDTLICGGDTADFVLGWATAHHHDPAAFFYHISTGGGASLELMEGKKLPGVEALMDR
ncbi:MAG TPA: phosphoglycerate kinase [Candidatus Saccharimonadales bacterium]|nr:phosphoglycerate kinase [Candidatus Saccharimonadales bacterium]